MMKFSISITLPLLLAVSTLAAGDESMLATGVVVDETNNQEKSGNNLRRDLQVDGEDEIIDELFEMDDIFTIVGGYNALSGEFGNFAQYFGGSCGSTLIWDDIVLGAAHCGLPRNNGLYIKGNSTRRNEGDFTRFVTQSRRHWRYDDTGSTLDFDFFIMKLDNPVPRNVVTPSPPNRRSNIPAVGESLIAVGYGDQCTNCQQWPTQMQKVGLRFVPHVACNANYGGDLKRRIHLCAIGAGRDTCQGDSGGPIYDHTGTLVGITSFGRACAQRGSPGVYARVSGASDWIHGQICCLSSNPPDDCTFTESIFCISLVSAARESLDFLSTFALRYGLEGFEFEPSEWLDW